MYDLQRGVIVRVLVVVVFFIGSFAISDLFEQTNLVTGLATYGVSAVSDEVTSGWNKTLYPGSGTYTHAIFSVLNDSAGNIILVGDVFNSSANPPVVNSTGLDWQILKFNSSGSLLSGWNITYSANQTNAHDDMAYDAALDSQGNLYVVGVDSISGIARSHAKKYNASGEEIASGWNKTITYEQTGNTGAYGVDIDSSDNIYIATTNRGGALNFFSLFKYYSNGTKQWDVNLSSSSDSLYDYSFAPSTDPRYIDVVVNDSGYAFVSFFDDDFGTGGWRVQGYYPNSSLLWEYFYENPSGMPVRMQVINQHLYVVGADYDSNTFTNSWMIKRLSVLDGTENTTNWNITYTDPDGGVYATSVGSGPDNSVFVIGTEMNVTSGNNKRTGVDWRINRYQEDGTLNSTWNITLTAGFNGTSGSDDTPYSQAYVPNDGLYVGGFSQEPTGDFTYVNRWWAKKFETTTIPTPSVTCQEITSSTSLTQNLTSPGSTCFTINQSNVVLEGLGYKVVGNSSGSGIYILNQTNVTIQNIILSNFSNNIEIVDSSVTVNNVTLLSITASPQNEYGLVINESNVTISNSTINATNSIADAIYVLSNSSQILDNVLISNSAGTAINIGDSHNLQIRRNSIYIDTLTSTTAIRTLAGPTSNLTLSHNNIFGNSGNTFGIILNNATNTTIEHNYINSSGDDGSPLTISDSSGINVVNNSLHSVITGGTAVSLGNNVSFSNNTITAGDGVGVRAVSSSSILTNTVTVGDATGIYISGSHNIIEGNTISNSGSTRVDPSLYVSGMGLTNNSVSANILLNLGANSAVIRFNSANSTLIRNTLNTTAAATYGLYLVTDTQNLQVINNTVYTQGSYAISDSTGGYNNSLVYQTSHGKINWTHSSLTTEMNLTLNETIFVQENLLGVIDDEKMGVLNDSAILTFYNIDSELTPYLLKNGDRCDNTDLCNISSFSGTTLVVNVSSFSNYSAQPVAAPVEENNGGSSSGGGGGGGGGSSPSLCTQGYERVDGKCTKIKEDSVVVYKDEPEQQFFEEEQNVEKEQVQVQEKISVDEQVQPQEPESNLAGNAFLLSVENFADDFRQWILFIALLIIIGGLSIVLTVSLRHHVREKQHLELSEYDLASLEQDPVAHEPKKQEEPQVPVHILRESQLDKPVAQGYSPYDSQLAEIDRKLAELDGPSDGQRIIKELKE